MAIGNSTDIFRIGAFAMRLAKAGLIAFVTTSGPPLVHPHGGRERLLSTNPLAIGIPRRGDPFVVWRTAEIYAETSIQTLEHRTLDERRSPLRAGRSGRGGI